MRRFVLRHGQDVASFSYAEPNLTDVSSAREFPINRITSRIAITVAVALLLAGCGSRHAGSPQALPRLPTPAAGDTAGQIMSVTGQGFIVCGVGQSAPIPYTVTVCGDLAKARAVLDARFPGQTAEVAYAPDDGGPHTPQQLVVQYWIMRTTGAGFTITESQITDSGIIDVGVDGELDKARAVLDRRFPGWTRVHAESAGIPL